MCKNASTEELILSLLNLWKESVKASHHFLTESDIHNLIPDVCLALKSVEDYFGCGFGKRLMDIAIKDYGCTYVDVNEQNPKARNFYRHLGFQEYERTAYDEQGRPFPIIKMELHIQQLPHIAGK